MDFPCLRSNKNRFLPIVNKIFLEIKKEKEKNKIKQKTHECVITSFR